MVHVIRAKSDKNKKAPNTSSQISVSQSKNPVSLSTLTITDDNRRKSKLPLIRPQNIIFRNV